MEKGKVIEKRFDKNKLDEIWEQPVKGQNGGNILIIIAAFLILVLVVVLVLLPKKVQDQKTPLDLAQRIDSLNVAKASDQLASDVSKQQKSLQGALFEGDIQTMASLLKLQAKAAQVELVGFKLVENPRDSLLQPIEIDLTVAGAYYDLPIFIDGLYRNKWIAMVTSVSVESQTPMAAIVTSRIRVRFFRPVEPDIAIFSSLVEEAGVDRNNINFAASGLRDAACLISYEAFNKNLPKLQLERDENRRLVLRTIPTMIRKLPGSPMDWVGAVFEGTEAILATEH